MRPVGLREHARAAILSTVVNSNQPIPTAGGFVRVSTAVAVRRITALAVAVLVSGNVRAASLTWGTAGAGGSGVWDANGSANWFNGSSSAKWPVPGGVDDDAVFSGVAGIVTPAPGGIIANDLTFTSSGYAVETGTLTLNGTAPAIAVAAGVTATIRSGIAGSGGLVKTGSGTLVLTGDNGFTGNVTISSGNLHLASPGSLGTSPKTLMMQGTGRVLQLSGNITIPPAVGFAMSSNSFDGGGINNLGGSNRISGNINFSTGNPALNISSADGALTISGNLTLSTSSRTLYLGGASTGANTISGVIGQSHASNILSVVKQGAGTWNLSGSNTHAGGTSITSGKLVGVAGGSCANSAVVLAAAAGRSATLGLSVTDNTKQWTCSSLAINNGGNASDLEFDFGAITPGSTLAPLMVTGALGFTTTPDVRIIADSNLGPVGARFPLVTWGTVTGVIPTACTIVTSNPTTAHLEVTGNTLFLVIDDYTPTLSDTQLFSALNLDHAGLETVKTHVLAGDFPAAKAALATYLRTRTNVNWRFDWRHPTANVSYDKTGADTTIAGTFSYGGYTRTFSGGNIDWLYSPSPTSQWVSLINRMNFWPNYGATYWGTTDESYVTAWVRQLRSWITQCPAPGANQGILSSWATIQAAERMRTWPDTFLRFILSPSFTDEDVVLYLKSTIENTRYLRQYAIGAAMNFNIDAWELNGIYTTATVFPELNESAEWRVYAVQQMDAQQQIQFYPDGVHIELSPRYHIGTLGFIKGIYDLAWWNHRLADFPPGYIQRTEKAYEFLLYSSTPDRLLPPFNDCGAANEDTRDYLDDGYQYFPQRTDFLWTSGGGTKPAKTSWIFPYAGQALMRSGWESDANFLCFDAGPLGSSGHRHDDSLNVVLWAYGREMLFDSGGGSYESSVWRSWGTSSFSHNCITVDGLDHEGGDGGYAAVDPDYQSQGPRNIRWESGAAHDFAAGVYNRGYGGNYNNRPASQTRRVLFVKPDIYLVADTMVPANTASHVYQARWHLIPPNATVDPVTKAVVSNEAGKSNLAVVPCLAPGLVVDAVSARLANNGGSTPVLSEMLGWDQPNLSSGTQTPATTVTHTLSGTGIKQFLTLFLPLKPNQPNPVVSVTNTGATSAEVLLNDGRRLQVHADPDPAKGLKLTEILADSSTGRYVGAGFTPPVIAGLANRTAPPGSAVGPLAFTVTSSSAVSVRSLNPEIVPDAGLTLGGSGANRSITAALLAGKTGIAPIVVTATAPDGSTTSESFDIVASYPPDSPPTALPGNAATIGSTPVDIDLRTLVADAFLPVSDLMFSVSNAQFGTVTLLSDGHTARFTPSAGFSGAARFEYSVTNLGQDDRIYAWYGIEPPDDPFPAVVSDLSLNSRTAAAGTVGNGSAQLSTDVPAALAGFSTRSLQLTEAGDFNGARLRRTISHHDFDINDHDWTFACWFKRSSNTSDDFIMHLGTGNGFGADEELQLYGLSGKSQVGLAHWNGTTADVNMSSAAVAPAGLWNHVAVTYTRTSSKRGNLAFHVNGALVGTADDIPLDFDPSGAMNIGGHGQTNAAVSRWFNGLIDEVVIFNAALDPSEVGLLASQPVSRLGGLTVSNIVGVSVGVPAGLNWNTPVTIANESDVLNAGTVKYAFTWSNTAAAVNGVPFTAANGTTSAGGGQVTMSGFTTVNTTAFLNPSGINSSGEYAKLTRGAVYGGNSTVTLNHLTAGRVYAAQVWVNDSRSTTRTQTLAAANSTSLDFNHTNAAGGAGQSGIGGFTASAGNQTFTLSAAVSQLNALQVRDVTGVWRGGTSGIWDTTSANFTGGQDWTTVAALTNTASFADTDGFGQPVVNPTVAIPAPGVTAGHVRFQNHTLPYLIQSSAGSAGISGAATVTLAAAGTVTLNGTHSYTGPTTVQGGRLVLDGTLSSPVVVNAGIFAPVGASLTSGGLVLGGSANLEIRTGSSFSVGGNVSLAGNLDVAAAPGVVPGSTIVVIHKTGAGAVSGTFVGKPDGSVFTAAGINWWINYTGGDGNDVVITVASAADLWRFGGFGTAANTHTAADASDANGDGEVNLLEFATGQNPLAGTTALTSLSKTAAGFDFIYLRSKAAFDEGCGFAVEYSDTLATSWTPATAEIIVADGPLQTVKVPIPGSSNGKRFVRLRVVSAAGP